MLLFIVRMPLKTTIHLELFLLMMETSMLFADVQTPFVADFIFADQTLIQLSCRL